MICWVSLRVKWDSSFDADYWCLWPNGGLCTFRWKSLSHHIEGKVWDTLQRSPAAVVLSQGKRKSTLMNFERLEYLVLELRDVVLLLSRLGAERCSASHVIPAPQLESLIAISSKSSILCDPYVALCAW